MNSKKSIRGNRAHSVHVTRSMTLTVEDAKLFMPSYEKAIKKLLNRKRRHLPDGLFLDEKLHV